MITEWFIGLWNTINQWVNSLWPANYQVPAWFTDFGAQLASFLSDANGLGVWIPWQFITVVVGGILALWLALLSVKLLRWVIGLFPTMGGG